MKYWRWVVVGFLLLSLGTGAGAVTKRMNTWLPWWRVEVRNEIPDLKLRANKIKLAWVLGKFGIWEQGAIAERESESDRPIMMRTVPRKVVFIVNTSEYPREGLIDLKSNKILYGVDDAFLSEDLVVKVGLPNLDFFGAPSVMTGNLNSQILKTMWRLSRKTMTVQQIQVAYPGVVSSLPPFMIQNMMVIK